MVVRLRLDQIFSEAMIAAQAEHIKAFISQAGITSDAEGLGATVMTERQLKELMAELAEAAE